MGKSLSCFSFKDLCQFFKMDLFYLPVCIDFDGELNKLNDFPPFPQFHTLLLDKDNKVLVIGNPVHSTEIRSLYFKQLSETYDTANEKDDKLINPCAPRVCWCFTG